MFMAQAYERDYDPGIILTVVLLEVVSLVICARKGKLGAGLVGVVIPFMVFGVAIRIAKPDSRWAREYYPPYGEKMRIARLRFPALVTSVAPVESRSDTRPGNYLRPHGLVSVEDELAKAAAEADRAKRLRRKSRRSRIWEGMLWYIALANALFAILAIVVGDGELAYDGDPTPWWVLALIAAGLTLAALRLRARRHSRATQDEFTTP